MYPRLIWCPMCKRFDNRPHFHFRKEVDYKLDKKPAEVNLERI
jgi:hypothetical protein